MAAITLQTERLILRRPVLADAPRIAELIGNWSVCSMLSRVPFPYARKDAEWWLTHKPFGLLEHDREALVITGADNGAMGVVGLHRHDGDEVELGYWLGEPYWGLGFMTEAASAVVDYAFAVFDLDMLASGHFSENLRSANVLEKLGFAYVGEEHPQFCRARGAEVPHRSLALTRARWKERKTQALRAARQGGR